MVIPTLRPLAAWLNTELGWIPFFGTSLSGPEMLPAAIVLAIMILPTIAAVSQDAPRRVPYKVKEAAYGMGTTRWEAILRVMLPTASSGIFGAMVLGFGRALGETMALAMLIGNANQISLSCSLPQTPWLPCWPQPSPRADRNRGIDVCGHGASSDHDGSQYHRSVHYELIRAEV